jgi:tetratricopeptide (TPR) repeat protein
MKHSVLKFLLTFIMYACSSHMYAQQSRIDSIVHMLKNSKNGKEIDTARFSVAVNLIEKTRLNDESIGVLEKAGRLFINGKDEYWSYRVKYSIMNSLIATDKNKSLAYGKSQLAELGKSKIPNVTMISSGFIKLLRLPYRNSDMLNEGFQYFNENLKIFKQKNDSAGLADCYYVLAGFYRTIGLLDQAIYHMKKSVSYMRADTAKDNSIFPFTDPVGRSMWFNNTGVIGYYYLQKGDYKEALKYATITFKDYKRSNSTVNQNIPNTMAQAKLLSGKLDSVMYYLDMSLKHEKNITNPDYIAASLQIKGYYLLKTGEMEEAEATLMQCWQLIEDKQYTGRCTAWNYGP